MNNKESIWRAPYRALTIGIMLVVTAVAFEGLAVTTIAPALALDLKGEHLYAWIFSAYLLSQLVGTIVTGQLVDRVGPMKPFIVTILMFSLGILLSALASSMPVFILGRVLQGLGAGAIINCVYTAITLRFSDALRPRILAVFSSAYVLPGLIGPYFAGLLAEQLSWRYVFWLVLPIVLIATFLTTPSFKGLRAAIDKPKPFRFVTPLLLAIGTGILLTGLSWLPHLRGILLAAAGLVLLAAPVRSVLPAGTLTARPGLPALIAARGLFVATYFGTQTYLVLVLTSELGFSANIAGLAVASAAISWSLAANVQARLDRKHAGSGRNRRVVAGLLFMLVGTLIVIPQAWLGMNGFSLSLAIASQVILGFGIGLAHSTSSALALSFAKAGEEGKVSADLAVADTFTPAVVIGAAGAVLAIARTIGWSTAWGLTIALALQFLLVLIGLFAAARFSSHNRLTAQQPRVSQVHQQLESGS